MPPSLAQSARRRKAFLARQKSHPLVSYFEQRFTDADWYRLELAGVKPQRLLIGDENVDRYGPGRLYKNQ